jgi:hypothetical protein
VSSDTDGVRRAVVGRWVLAADPEDLSVLDGRDDRQRAELIAERLSHWRSIKSG